MALEQGDMQDALAMRDELAKAIRTKGDAEGIGSPKVRMPHARVIAEYLIEAGVINLERLFEMLSESDE